MDNVSNEQFEHYVSEAIDHIPDAYKEVHEDVVFKVEPEPSPSQRKRLGLRRCDALYGLYEGVPRTKRNGQEHALLPDVITVFMHPMVEHFPDIPNLRKQIYETVWHEVAHYFGLDHSAIHKAKKP